MATTTNAAKLELGSCPPDYMKNLYSGRNGNADTLTLFEREYSPTTWHATNTLKMARTEDKSELTATYTVDPTSHVLEYSYLRYMLPSVQVKPAYIGKYRIAWGKNVGSNRIINANFTYLDQEYPGFDRVFLDDYYEWFLSGEDKITHAIGVGNVPALLEFSNYLPAYPINIEQPWFYSAKCFPGWPILNTYAHTPAQHNYTFADLRSLLRVQVSDGRGGWENVSSELEADDINGIVTFGKTVDVFPDLHGKYALLNPAEYNSYMGICNGVINPEFTRKYYVRDVIITDSPNDNVAGSTCVVPLESKTLCLGFFWKCSNVQAAAAHDPSNYTTNPNCLQAGSDPVVTSSLKYGNVHKFKKMPSDHFNLAVSRYHFPSCPRDPGYHGYVYANDPSSGDTEIGVLLGQGPDGATRINSTLEVEINNPSQDLLPHKNEEEIVSSKTIDTEGTKSTYITHVRMLTQRELTIARTADGFSFTLV